MPEVKFQRRTGAHRKKERTSQRLRLLWPRVDRPGGCESNNSKLNALAGYNVHLVKKGVRVPILVSI